ncbi:hypothetical protein FRC17_002411 [Serendipita sp. 399]|nr:hypothetical protein FRC17_002411 [Serendipita sp. 399]
MTDYEKTPRSPTTAITATSRSFMLKSDDIEVQRPVDEVHFKDEKELEGGSDGRSIAPMRKYTIHWWKKTWDGAIRIGTWPRLLYCAIGLIFLACWIGIMLSFVGAEVLHGQSRGGSKLRANLFPAETKNLQESVHRQNAGSDAEYTILLKGSLVNFDMEKRNLAISWSGLFSYNKSEEPVEFGLADDPNSPSFEYGIEIYRDVSSEPVNATYVEEDGNVNVTSWAWTYRVDNRTAKPIGVIGKHSWDSFDTDITFTQKRAKDAWRQPLLGYPFDQWHGEIVFVANNVIVADFFNITAGGVMEIAGIQLADSTLNWRFTFEFDNTCGGPEGTSTIDYTTPNVSTLPRFCHTKIEFDGVRPPLLIFCAVAAVLVNWSCALFIFVLTCEAIIMRRSYMLQGTDILSMCFTALFALPTIRSLLPGAPAYGAIIDLVGILPCTLIVALCAVCVSVAKLNKRYKSQKEE